MSKVMFHASIEGAQHGAKSLDQFLAFAKQSGAAGAGPSNYIVEKGDGFMSAQEILDTFEKHDMKMDGVSCHCPFWAHTTAWTGSPTIRPFLPKEIWSRSVKEIEQYLEDYLMRFLDLSAEIGNKIIPMFWGVSGGWELATGYPFGFFQGPEYDLEKEALELFVTKTAKLRDHANKLGIYLCHEIHPNSAAMTAQEFLDLVAACDGDQCLGVTADPSHCWEGEGPEARFTKVSDRVYAAAVKNFVVHSNAALRTMKGDWQQRAMQFCDLATGDLNLMRFVELLIKIGYAQRYCKVMGTATAPLVTEAESVYRDLDATSANAIAYAANELCFPVASGSFEDGMGA